MFAQGIPALVQGSEWLEDRNFGSGWDDRINWDLRCINRPIFNYFRDIIHVRKTNGALRADAGINIMHVNETDNVLAFHRWDLSGNRIMVVASFNNNNFTDYQMPFPENGTWYELVNSQATVYDGNGWGNGGSIVTDDGAYGGWSQSARITIPRMGLLVFRYEHAPEPRCFADLDGNDFVDFDDLNILLANYGQTAGATQMDGDLDGDCDVDFDDLNVLLASYGGPCY